MSDNAYNNVGEKQETLMKNNYKNNSKTAKKLKQEL